MVKLIKRARRRGRSEPEPAPVGAERRGISVMQTFPSRIKTEIPRELLSMLCPARWPHAGDDGSARVALMVIEEISAAAIASAGPPGIALYSCHSADGMTLMNFDELRGFDRIVVWSDDVEAPEFLLPERILSILAFPSALPEMERRVAGE